MPGFEVDNLDSIGVVRDQAAYQLPPEALTRADNMRVVNGALVRMLGNEQVFGTPPAAPHMAVPISTLAQTFWLYVSLAKGYAYDGASYTNLTRQTAGVDVNYNAAETRNWNSTILAGIPILNNGVDTPQYWGPVALATKLQNMPAWPSGLKTRRLIAFGAYLIGLNFIDGSSVYPHLVRWSSSVSSPGSLPGSWDYTDPENDAGAYDLPDVNSGVLMEAAPLGGLLMVYKEQSSWAMRRIGGRAVFSFDPVFTTMGILAQRCVSISPTGTFHFLATQDDLVIHTGQGEPKSALEKKLRKEIFANIDTTNYINSFCYTDPEYGELHFCYPESGQTQPNREVVVNAKTGAVTEGDVAFRNVAVGVIEEATDTVWDAATQSWDSYTGTWTTAQRRRVVVCDPANNKFFQLNKGLLRNGASFDATVQRVGLSILGKDQKGNPIVDHEVMKFVDRIWPKVRGGPIKIRIGFQQKVDGPVSWKPYKDFNPATKMTIDSTGVGRAVAVEFFSDTPVEWALDGYKVSVKPVGQF